MKKKTTEIAKNTSSGAEKIEKIEKQVKTDGEVSESKVKKVEKQETEAFPDVKNAQKNTAKEEAALGNGKDSVNSNTLAEKEAKVAKARVDLALTRKEMQEKKKAERLKRKEERKANAEKREAEYKAKVEKKLAERKAMAEKRLAERKAKIEKRQAEREAMIRERAHEKANKNQEEHKRKAARAAHKAQRRENNKKEKKHGDRERNQGYGGWLAAVISLGAVTLALTTALTVGFAASRRAMADVTASTAPIRPARIACACSLADIVSQRSV